MSRSGYSDEGDNWATIKWRGQVASAIRGKRGQAFLRELRDVLDAMPVKRLIANSFIEGCSMEVCTLGAIAVARGADLEKLEAAAKADWNEVEGSTSRVAAEQFNIARQLAAEIMFENDEHFSWSHREEAPEDRWHRMRRWVDEQIKKDPA